MKKSLEELCQSLEVKNGSEIMKADFIEACKEEHRNLQQQFDKMNNNSNFKINMANNRLKKKEEDEEVLETINVKILKAIFFGETADSDIMQSFINKIHFMNMSTTQELTNQIENILADQELISRLKTAAKEWGLKFRSVNRNNFITEKVFKEYQEMGNGLLSDDSFKTYAIEATKDYTEQQIKIKNFLSQFQDVETIQAPQTRQATQAPHLIAEDRAFAENLQQQFDREGQLFKS